MQNCRLSLFTGSGTIELDEFVTMMSSRFVEVDEESELRQAFQVFDRNGREYHSMWRRGGRGSVKGWGANMISRILTSDGFRVRYRNPRTQKKVLTPVTQA